jgi:hypothetical protein
MRPLPLGKTALLVIVLQLRFRSWGLAILDPSLRQLPRQAPARDLGRTHEQQEEGWDIQSRPIGGDKSTSHRKQPKGVQMKRRQFLQSALVASATLQGCAGMEKMGYGGSKTPSVTDTLTSQLGVSPQQAAAGVGGMLSYAKTQLSPTDFSTVTQALPGADTYMKLASDALGSAVINNTAGLGTAFSKLGMSPEMVAKFAPVVVDYAGKYGTPAAKNLLAGVFK